jgi:hypothetical protein
MRAGKASRLDEQSESRLESPTFLKRPTPSSPSLQLKLRRDAVLTP